MTLQTNTSASQPTPHQRVVDLATRIESNGDRLLNRMEASAYDEGPQLVIQLYRNLVDIRGVLDELLQTPDQNRWTEFPLSTPCDQTGSFVTGFVAGLIAAGVYANWQAQS
jgi:hypothetical protein